MTLSNRSGMIPAAADLSQEKARDNLMSLPLGNEAQEGEAKFILCTHMSLARMVPLAVSEGRHSNLRSACQPPRIYGEGDPAD